MRNDDNASACETQERLLGFVIGDSALDVPLHRALPALERFSPGHSWPHFRFIH